MEDEIEFGHLHPVHRRIEWPNEKWKSSLAFAFPEVFLQYLCCNVPLPLNHHRTATEIRENLRVKVRQMDDLLLITTQVTYLEDCGESLKKKLFAFDVILSPFRRLSEDVLHEISLYCRPTENGSRFQWTSSTDYLPRQHIPSQLAGTCVLWRRTVHHMSALWQSINLDCSEIRCKGRNSDQLLWRLGQLSQLSRTLPMTMALSEFNTYSQKSIERAFKMLCCKFTKNPSSMRVHRLSIRANEVNRFFETFYRYAWKGLSLPYIKTFVLGEIGEPDSDGDNTRVTIKNDDMSALLKIFPNMRNFALRMDRKDSLTLAPSAFSLRNIKMSNENSTLSNLASIYLEPVLPLEEFWTLLKACPRLESIICELDGIGEDDPPPYPHLHSSLKELTLRLHRFSNKSILEPLARVVRAPYLSTLFLDMSDTEVLPSNKLNMQALRALKMFPSLITLVADTSHYHNAEDHDSGLHPLLITIPSTTTISVSFFHLASFLGFLDFFQENHSLSLPHLEKVNVGLCLERTSAPVESLATTLTRRLSGTSYAGLSFRIKMIGCPSKMAKELGRQRIQELYHARMKAVEASLRDTHNMDISIEVETMLGRDQCLIWDAPMKLGFHDWIRDSGC